MNKHIRGGLLITVSMVIFSLVGPFVRYISLPALVIIFYTSLFSAGLLLLYFRWSGKLHMLAVRGHLLLLVLSAVCILGNVYTFYCSYAMTTMANTILTHYTAPIFAALLAPLLLREKLERVTVLSLFISMTGLFCIVSGGIELGSGHVAGSVYGALSGFFYGMSILVSKRLTAHLDAFVIVFYQCVVSVIMVVPFLSASGYVLEPYQAGLLPLYALLVGVFAVFLYLRGLRFVEAQHAGILAYAEPLLVVVIGILFYDELPSPAVITGGVLIVLSGCLVLRAEAAR